MAQLRINANDTFTVDVTVRESDKYSKTAYLRIDRTYIPEEICGCNEMFLTPAQLENLGRFLMTQAQEMRMTQRQAARENY